MISDIASIIGATTGVLSLCSIIYLVGVWKGGIDSFKKEIEEDWKKYPPSEQHRMLQTLWEVYILDPLHKRTDLTGHHSPICLTPAGLKMIPSEIREALDSLASEGFSREDLVIGYTVVQQLGLEKISRMAEENNLSLQEMIALLACYLRNSISSRIASTLPGGRR